MRREIKVSVVIATYNREDCLINAVDSVLGQDFESFELLVIDQTIDHAPHVREYFKNQIDWRLRYYQVYPNSLTAARNFGLERARGEIVIYVDDDVILEPNFIVAHYKAYFHESSIAAIAGRIKVVGMPESDVLAYIDQYGHHFGAFDYPYPAEAQTVRGCNMSFRKSLLKSIGGFDTSFQGNALREESDVSFRLRKKGFFIKYEPAAKLEHREVEIGGTRSTGHRTYDNPSHYTNEILFFLKNMNKFNFPIFLLEIFRYST